MAENPRARVPADLTHPSGFSVQKSGAGRRPQRAGRGTGGNRVFAVAVGAGPSRHPGATRATGLKEDKGGLGASYSWEIADLELPLDREACDPTEFAGNGM